MPHNHQCYTLGNHYAEFHPIPSVGRNQCKFPIPCKSPFNLKKVWNKVLRTFIVESGLLGHSDGNLLLMCLKTA